MQKCQRFPASPLTDNLHHASVPLQRQIWPVLVQSCSSSAEYGLDLVCQKKGCCFTVACRRNMSTASITALAESFTLLFCSDRTTVKGRVAF